MVGTAHCLDEVDIAHGEGDEVWECDSEVESCTDAESEQDTDTEMPLPLPPSPKGSQGEKMIQHKDTSGIPHKMSAPLAVPMCPPKMAPLPEVQVRSVKTPSLQSQAQTSSPWMKGSMELAMHLRKDNERLRELLVEAQRDVEQVLESGQSKDNVDFAHLLELVKEFGNDMSDSVESGQGNETEMCVSFNTQEFRMDEDDVDEKDLEIKKLESELAELRGKLATQQSLTKPQLNTIDHESSMELVGYWVSSKTGELHHVVCADTDTDLDAPNAIEWEIIDVDIESVTLKSDNGVEHTVERLKTKMFGESLLWGSGDLWTLKSDA